jgi:hypothetical protein
MSAYRTRMSLRMLFSALVAIAVLFAPALSRAGEAFAAVPDHHMQMMETGHCKSAPSDSGGPDGSSDQDKAKTCCISMCMAVAVAPDDPPTAAALHGAAATFPLADQYHGCIAEIATPPPRLA